MYIRTENHIYLIHKDISYGGNKIYKIYNHDFSIIGNDFKVADTIEELCDRYIGISNNKPMIIKYEFDEYYDEYGDSYTKEELLMEYDIIYGAIYTSKGLIYVAKMNDKGELDLI